MIKFSIISVCYNCENEVDRTIQSLLAQTYKDYEYIVVDGKSTDNTVERVSSYRGKFQQMYIISEPDSGIYDAMNKGVKFAKGEYIFFLNMGDTFFSEDVLEYVSKRMMNKKDIYYGDIQKDNMRYCQKGRAKIAKLLYREYMICHQSIFARRNLLEKYPFDISYKICADRDWLIRVLKNGGKAEYMEKIIAHYDANGISSNLEKFTMDSLRIALQHSGKLCVIFIRIKRFVGKCIKHRY